MTTEDLQIIQSDAGLAADVRRMIEQTREGVARTVNAGMTLLYWRIGKRIQTEILGNQRAEYGKEILSTLSRQLGDEFGPGFSAKNLRHMVKFSEVFAEPEIVSTLSRQLGWSHFKEILYLKDDVARDFYAEMCRIERWSVRTLRKKTDSMLYERTAISKKPEDVASAELAALREEDKLTPRESPRQSRIRQAPNRGNDPRRESSNVKLRGILDFSLGDFLFPIRTRDLLQMRQG